MHQISAFSSACSSVQCVSWSAQRNSSNAAIKARWSGETLSGLNTHWPLWVPWTIPAVSTASARDDRQMGHMVLLCLREQEAHGYLTGASTLCIAQGHRRLEMETVLALESINWMFRTRRESFIENAWGLIRMLIVTLYRKNRNVINNEKLNQKLLALWLKTRFPGKGVECGMTSRRPHQLRRKMVYAAEMKEMNEAPAQTNNTT